MSGQGREMDGAEGCKVGIRKAAGNDEAGGMDYTGR